MKKIYTQKENRFIFMSHGVYLFATSGTNEQPNAHRHIVTA